jgi:hypothetical protein
MDRNRFLLGLALWMMVALPTTALAGIMLDNGCMYIRVEHNVLENIAGRPVHLQTDSGLTGHDNWMINNDTQDVGVKYQSGTRPSMWRWAPEYIPPYPIMAEGIGDLGVRFIDLNGDRILDMVYYRYSNGKLIRGAYLNIPSLIPHTGTTWQWSPKYTPPYHIVADGIGDLGARFVDLNGDGLMDLVYHRWFNGNVMKGAYLNSK